MSKSDREVQLVERNEELWRELDRYRYDLNRLQDYISGRLEHEVQHRAHEMYLRAMNPHYRFMPQFRGRAPSMNDYLYVDFGWMQQAKSSTGAWGSEEVKQLMAGAWQAEPEKESKSMNVVKRIKNLGLSKADKLLRKYQMVDQAGDLTGDGKEALWSILLEENKDLLVEKLTELETENKSKEAK